MTENYITLVACKRGHVYRVRSRNLAFGLFVPEKENGFKLKNGFIDHMY